MTENLFDTSVHLVELLRNFWGESIYFLMDSDEPVTIQAFQVALDTLKQQGKWQNERLEYGIVETIDYDSQPIGRINTWVPRRNAINKKMRRYSTILEARLLNQATTARGINTDGIPSATVTSYIAKAQISLIEDFEQPRDGSLAVPFKSLTDTIDLVGVFPEILIRGHAGNAHVPTGGPGGFPRPINESVYQAAFRSNSEGNKRVRIYVLDTVYTDEALTRGPRPPWWVEPITPPTPPQHKAFSVKRMRDMLTDATKLEAWQNQTAFQSRSPFNLEMYDHGPFIIDLILRYAPNAEIILVETMNKYGVGTLPGLQAVLEFLRVDMEAHKAIPKVVNMSFVFDLPDTQQVEKLLAEVTDLNARSIEDLNTVAVEEVIKTLKKFYANDFDQRFIEFLFQLYETVRLVDPDNTLWIAAAGNTTPLETTAVERRAAMMPANLPDVYGVMASNDAALLIPASNPGRPSLSPSPVPYTHFADKQHPGFPASEGRAGFGGNAVELQTTLKDGNGQKREVYISQNAVVGPYLNQDRFHLDILDATASGTEVELQALTHTGYVEWAGTSFAAAQVTGIVAERLARRSVETGDEAVQLALDEAINSIHRGRMPSE